MNRKLVGSTVFFIAAASALLAFVATSPQTVDAAAAGSINCTDSKTGLVDGNLSVPQGATCTLSVADVTGTVTVNGTLFIDQVTIHKNLNILGGTVIGNDDDSLTTVEGNVTADASTGDSNLCGFTILGSLTIKNSVVGSTWSIGGGGDADKCEPADEDGENVKVGKNLTLSNNSGAVSVGTVQTVSITGTLACTGNDSTPTLGDVTAQKRTGQCNI